MLKFFEIHLDKRILASIQFQTSKTSLNFFYQFGQQINMCISVVMQHYDFLAVLKKAFFLNCSVKLWTVMTDALQSHQALEIHNTRHLSYPILGFAVDAIDYPESTP